MKFQNINTSKKIFIVAEIGNNHEGSFELAKKMILEASKAGVDGVKFQTFLPEYYISNDDINRIELLKKFQLSYDQFEKLSIIAKEKGLIFFSTPFDIESAKFLNKIQPIFKISSGDNNFYPLIELVANYNKPIILSTGACNLKDIKITYSKISKIWKKKNKSLNQLAFLHCISSYPAPLDQTNLFSIAYLKKIFPKIVIGYSDHTLGIEAAVLSAGVGARIIEKHFTLDKNLSDFRDHQLSADPKEMSLLVKKVREAEKMLGSEEFKIQKSEKEMSYAGRRSIAVNRNLLKGSIISISDLIWLRPNKGFPPGSEREVIGKILNKNISKGTILKKTHFK